MICFKKSVWFNILLQRYFALCELSLLLVATVFARWVETMANAFVGRLWLSSQAPQSSHTIHNSTHPHKPPHGSLTHPHNTYGGLTHTHKPYTSLECSFIMYNCNTLAQNTTNIAINRKTEQTLPANNKKYHEKRFRIHCSCYSHSQWWHSGGNNNMLPWLILHEYPVDQ